MNKTIKTKLFLLIFLLVIPVIFFMIESKINPVTTYFNSIIFILATFVVTITIYLVLSIVIGKYPSFLETGIWKNPLFILIFGSFMLLIFIILMILVSNNIDFNPMTNKMVTFICSYPVVFVLILMVDAFLKGMLNIEREKRLFMSSMATVFGVAIFILLGMLGI